MLDYLGGGWGSIQTAAAEYILVDVPLLLVQGVSRGVGWLRSCHSGVCTSSQVSRAALIVLLMLQVCARPSACLHRSALCCCAVVGMGDGVAASPG